MFIGMWVFGITTVLAMDDIGTALDSEFKWLQEEAIVFTDIATKTQMDADLVPGLVTVLNGKDLRRRGFRTVLESLSMLPGLDYTETSSGAPIIVVRGTGGVVGSGKMKLMLNHAPMNDTYFGSAFMIYDIPTEQVDRIEIIRGPGSALYGKWAYVGVINVITRKDGNRIFGEYGRLNAWKGGVMLNQSALNDELDISINVARSQRDADGIQAGSDWLAENISRDYSYSPGSVDDSRSSLFGILKMTYGDLSLLAQSASLKTGEHFGFVGLLPPDETGSIESATHMVEINWHPDISNTFFMDWRLGYRESIYESKRLFIYPAGAPILNDNNEFIGINPYDMRSSPYYKERSVYGRAELHWNRFDHHDLLMGVEYEKIKVADVWQYSNYHPITGFPLAYYQRFQDEENWMSQDESRGIFSLYLQDLFELTERISLTGGLRYDHYDDTDDRLSPRIAGCYRLTHHHIIKAQYSEAFRPPSFSEMHSKNNPSLTGNPDIDPETVKTFELAYVYRKKPFTGRVALFYSRLKDLIIVDHDTAYYKNIGKADTRGVEIEAQYRLMSNLTADASVSYLDTEDDSTGMPIEGATKWLADAGLMFNPINDLYVSIQYNYVGKRHRGANDPRGKLGSYQTVRLCLTYENFLVDGLQLRTGISNLFDEDVRYPAAISSYTDDYPQPERQWWFQCAYDFDL